MSKKTEVQLCMEDLLTEVFGEDSWEEEYLFARSIGRMWKFDYAIPMPKIAIEIEGLGGRHQTVAGFIEDMAKYNCASGLFGWRLLRFTTKQALNGEAKSFLEGVRKAIEMGWPIVG